MRTRLKDILQDIKSKELKQIKVELTPHFADHGELYICNNHINIRHIAGHFKIIDMTPNGVYKNDFSEVYDVTGLNPCDIFEDVSFCTLLDDVKIKPVKIKGENNDN